MLGLSSCELITVDLQVIKCRGLRLGWGMGLTHVPFDMKLLSFVEIRIFTWNTLKWALTEFIDYKPRLWIGISQMSEYVCVYIQNVQPHGKCKRIKYWSVRAKSVLYVLLFRRTYKAVPCVHLKLRACLAGPSKNSWRGKDAVYTLDALPSCLHLLNQSPSLSFFRELSHPVTCVFVFLPDVIVWAVSYS